ncbi:aldehyde dehydrogenase family protein, partial [Litorivivens sp.]
MSQPSFGEQRLYINGELVDAEQGRVYENINPATEEIIGVAADASLKDADAALAAARTAFDHTDWASNHALRLKVLRRFVEVMRENIEELRQASQREVGATRCFALGPQCDGPISMASWPLDFLEGFQW